MNSLDTGKESSHVFVRSILLIFLLWLFLCSVNGIGASFKYFKETVDLILGATSGSPVLGLLVGVITTSLVQSSSTTTSLIVGLVASGAVSIEQAVPMIMGANIGTTITNTIVSLGSLARREEFKRAFAAANIHDVFNLLAVAILLPIESFFHIIARSADQLSMFFYGAEVEKPHSPIKAHFKVVVKSVLKFFEDLFGESGAHFALLIVSAAVMIAALALIVKTMKGVILAKAEIFFDRFIGKSAIIAMIFGAVLTALVQSSSVTTSLMVPLAGAGAITLRNLFPVTLGCNIGTTITALLAAIASGSEEALTIALCHVLFNIYGIVALYGFPPMRNLILFLSQKLATMCARHRWFAPLYVLTAFFVIPSIALLIQYWDKIMLWLRA